MLPCAAVLPCAVVQVEDAELQARARALLPLDQLRHEAQEAADLNTLLGAPASSMLGLDDFLVQGLLAFFKRDFFTWVGDWGWQGILVMEMRWVSGWVSDCLGSS